MFFISNENHILIPKGAFSKEEKEEFERMLEKKWIINNTKGSKEMKPYEDEERTITIETVFRTLINSHTYLYFKDGNTAFKNDVYSTLESIKITLKHNAFEKKEIVIAKKCLELIELILGTYKTELKMSKPETKTFNNIICDIKQSFSERERI